MPALFRHRPIALGMLLACVVLSSVLLPVRPAGAVAATAAAWPAEADWMPYTYANGTPIGDTNDDQSPTYLDLVSGVCAACVGDRPSVLSATDGTNEFFRVRMAVDDNDASKGGLFGGAFLVQLADASNTVRAVVGVDGKSASADDVYVATPAGVTTVAYSYPFTGAGAAMRWIPVGDGSGQYFLDFQVPMAMISTVSGGAITSATPIKLYFGSSAAANLAVINKDYMIPGATSVDFTTLATTKLVVPDHVVSFDEAGGSTVADQTVREGDRATAPGVPTRAGWTFAGWYTDATAGTQWNFADPVAGDLTLHAHWAAITHTVSFATGGGSTVGDQLVPEGQTPTRPADPTRSGYDFLGWVTASGGSTPFDFTAVPTTGVTAYAQWSARSYAVDFDSDGGDAVVSQSVLTGGTVTEPAVPTRAGWTFGGWFQGAHRWDFGADTVGAAGLVLTAHWSQGTATVTFDDGSGTDDRTVGIGSAVTPPSDPSRPGYTFLGWFTDVSATVPADLTAPVTADLTVYAGWTRRPHTVRLDPADSDPVATVTVLHGDPVAPSTPSWAGHTFLGWFTDVSATVPADLTAPVTADLTLHAGWALATYRVDFDSAGGSTAVPTMAAFGTPLARPAVERRGYDLLGWFGSGREWDFATDTVGGPLTLVARWTPRSYRVSFVGAEIADQTVSFGGRASEPPTPARDGYRFLGWFQGDRAWDFSRDDVEDSTVLTARWSELDTDGDGLTDLDEIARGTSPTDRDTDHDGLADGIEVRTTPAAYPGCSTSPVLADTDGDGLSDGVEGQGTVMTQRTTTRFFAWTIGLVRTDPCRRDTDGDHLTDGTEIGGFHHRRYSGVWFSSPVLADSDGDGVRDRIEVTGSANRAFGRRPSDPLDWDTDHGGISDLDELTAGSNPSDASSWPTHP